MLNLFKKSKTCFHQDVERQDEGNRDRITCKKCGIVYSECNNYRKLKKGDSVIYTMHLYSVIRPAEPIFSGLGEIIGYVKNKDAVSQFVIKAREDERVYVVRTQAVSKVEFGE